MKKNKNKITPQEAMTYREAQEAIFIYRYYDGGFLCELEFWGCPRCKNVIEREGQKFCGSCGQRISWKNFYKKNK